MRTYGEAGSSGDGLEETMGDAGGRDDDDDDPAPAAPPSTAASGRCSSAIASVVGCCCCVAMLSKAYENLTACLSCMSMYVSVWYK